MAFCGKCGTQLSEGAKFCPKCGSPSNYRANPCPKCGNQLSDAAKFCPKCGSSVGSKVHLADNTSNLVEESPITSYSQAEERIDSKGKKWIGYGVFAIVFFAACYFLGAFDDNKSSNKEVKQQTEQTKEATINPPTIKKSQEEDNSEKQKDAEFQRKIMDYTSQIQQIMVQMNNIYNGYVASRGSDYMNEIRRVNTKADLSNLWVKGDRIFDKMIDLARRYRYQDAIDMLKQEKQNFRDTHHQMERVLMQDMY